MPDLLTHILVPSLFKKKFQKYFLIVLLGAILPDIISKIPRFFLENRFYQWQWFFQTFHTLVGLLLLCLLTTFFFEEKERQAVFKFLLIGVVSHVILDSFQQHFALGTQGYHWFFPFTWQDFTIPLFWPETSLYFIPALLIIFVLIECFHQLGVKKSRRNFLQTKERKI